MGNRPIGDDTDQKLRRTVTNLADVAPTAPEFEDLVGRAVLRDTQQPAARNRRPMFALAFAAVLVIGGLFALTIDSDDDNVALEHTVESVDQMSAPELWTDYLASTERPAVQQCLADWVANRDINFRIRGDQFNASRDVSEFNVSSGNAASWTTRHLAVLRLAAAAEGDSSPKSVLIDELAGIQQGLDDLSTTDRIDIAPALNAAGADFDSMFFSDVDCPLGAAADRSPVQVALEAYSLQNDEPIELAAAVRCADAALLLYAAEAAIAMPSADTATRLSLAVEIVESGDAARRDPLLAEFAADHRVSPLEGVMLANRTANLRDGFPETYFGCPLF